MNLLRDYFSAFDDAVAAHETNAPLTASWRFAHAETVVPFANLLGLYQAQEPMTATNRDDDRYFTSSRRVTFAANVVAGLYSCEGGSYKVRFLYNEEEVVLPVCTQEGPFCGLETLRDAYQGALEEWDYSEVCDGSCLCEW